MSAVENVFLEDQDSGPGSPPQTSSALPYPYYPPYYYAMPSGTSVPPSTLPLPAPENLPLPDQASYAAAVTALSGTPRSRSRNQSDIGPYFKPTKQTANIYSMDRNKTYTVRINPRIDRGFFLAENDWTCYRRNYFQATASFNASDAAGQKVDLPCLVELEGRGLRTVTEFQLHVVSRSSNGTREIELVQHTAKRDKGPQILPGPKTCLPQEVTPGYARAETEGQTSVTWERIQFKSATANNGKRRAAQQYHVLYVELLAKCEDGYLARVASCESAPLVVRGRAPGHYAAMATKGDEDGEQMHEGFPYPPVFPPPHLYPGYYPSGNGQTETQTQNGQQPYPPYYYHPYYANPSLWANAAAAAAATGQTGMMPMPYPYMMPGAGDGTEGTDKVANATNENGDVNGDKESGAEESTLVGVIQTEEETVAEGSVKRTFEEPQNADSSHKRKRGRAKNVNPSSPTEELAEEAEK